MKATKIAAVATGLAMATSMLSLAPVAHAATLTTSQVSSIVSLLSSFGADSATIANVSAALTGTAAPAATTGSSATFTKDLTIGSSGADVTALQNALIAKGYAIAAGATGYFGAQTQSAVAKWQVAAGVTPAAGYFGAKSRAAFGGTTTTTTTGGTTTTTTTTTTTGALTGNGRLTGESTLGDVTSDLHNGDSATRVIGESFDATGGDVAVQRVDATFVIGGTTGSANLDKYVSDVSLYLGDTKLASADPSTGDKNSRTWTIRFSGLNGVIKSGTTGNLYVKVTPLSSIGTNEDVVKVTAELLADSVRAISADGISDTYVATANTQDFTVSSATKGTLTVTAAGDNPTASQVAVASTTTTGVMLLSFNVKAKNSAITITDLGAGFETSDSLSDVVNTVYLMKGSTVLKSKTLSTGTGGLVAFTDINQTIAKDSTVNYKIVADLKGDAAYADGTTLVASTTASVDWDVSDAEGATVTPSAAAAGNTQTLTATGISVAKNTVSATTNGVGDGGTAHDTGVFVIPFTVTAGDNDVFISGVTDLTSATTKIVYATTTTSGAAKTGVGSANFTAANTVSGDSAGAYYKVLAGTSRVFTLTVSYTAAATGYTGLQLSSIAYGLTSSLGSTYSSNLDTFKTNDIQLVY
ncbi:MAG: peptidoglycan-binding protein [Candidatus Kaiserbacteria bacterium]|nr:peptidoglycan-binding protein [Candidatus Kaiserbacteria bacterium]